jgi:hypothetical protein
MADPETSWDAASNDVTIMAPAVFDALQASIDVPDACYELEVLSGVPRLIDHRRTPE